ncbi:MAG: hypothetical protein ACR2OG_03235 [Gemmatimonadaceae bacterium]
MTVDRSVSPDQLYRTPSVTGRNNLSTAVREVVFWIAVASCAVAQVAIVRLAVRATPRSEVPETGALSRSGRGMEIAWTLIPAGGLIVVLLLTWRAWHP